MKRWMAMLLACAMLLTTAVCASAETGMTEEVPAESEPNSVHTNAEAGTAGELPVKWDLDSIYANVEEWQADYDEVMGMLDRYEDFRGTLNNARAIYDYLQFGYYTELTEKQSKLKMYAQLGSYLDSTDPVFTEMNAKLAAEGVDKAEETADAA